MLLIFSRHIIISYHNSFPHPIPYVFVKAAIRRMLAYRHFKSARVASQTLKAEDTDRRARLRRIQEREKELVLLRALPATEYFRLDKIRSESAAKSIQKQWRRMGKRKLARMDFAVLNNDKHPSPLSEKEVAAAKERDDLLGRIRFMTHSPHDKRAGRMEVAAAATGLKYEVDALGLAQLRRRVHDASRRRLREADKIDRANIFKKSTPAIPSSFAETANDLGDDDFSLDLSKTVAKRPASAGPASSAGRAQMQRLMELQQTCRVWVCEYGDARSQLMASQEARLKSLGHCKKLVQQTMRLPSLDEAKATLKLQQPQSTGGSVASWLWDEDIISAAAGTDTRGLAAAVTAHQRTLHAVTHR